MNRVEAEKLQKRLKPLLIPFSLLYGAVVNIKEGYSKPKISFDSLKVISIGNITVGGSGKTPVAISLAERLMRYGKVCVITNIYPLKDKRAHVVSIDGNIFKKPPKVPDEAYMIAKKLPITVIASKNRIAALELAVSLKMDFAILDDALHITRLKKDIEICVFDDLNLNKKELYLPAGMIRNSKKLLKRCSFKICTQNKKTDECMKATVKPKGVFDHQNRPVEYKNRSAFVFCGIGNPNSFLKTIELCGIKIKGYQLFDDHHLYTDEEIEALKRKQKEIGAELLLTTLKDFVKLEDDEIVYLDIDLEIEKIDEIVKEIVQ
ncbi:tetraacyldisaccharide 4'-kinase [Hippea alviniae]|uniref:tetraacyldisaccharide 4'-kinase n=1 Tax=Hippea alviniae TaxID=1279027 RepID=UPI0003B430E4|nr:tetraacyldisaccharide 4'-kinase [Hippea alviniae]